MAWLAQFVEDLLQQTGLVPMEETNQEALGVSNQDKLVNRQAWTHNSPFQAIKSFITSSRGQTRTPLALISTIA